MNDLVSSEPYIVIAGDTCPYLGHTKSFDNMDENAIFGECAAIIKAADFAFCNLECPFTDSQTAISKPGPHLKNSPAYLEIIRNVGFTHFGLANNHIMDFGLAGIDDTLEQIKQRGGIALGASGEFNTDTPNYRSIIIDGKSIALITLADREFNYSQTNGVEVGASIFDPCFSLAQIRDLKAQFDFVICIYHGGMEYFQFPSPELRKICRAIADFGADVVLCQHSHCIGCEEHFGEARIVYGQGNFLYGYRNECDVWNSGLLLKVSIVDEKIQLDYVVTEAHELGISIAPEYKARQVMSGFFQRSERLRNAPHAVNKDFEQLLYARHSLIVSQAFGWPVWLIRLNRLVQNKIFDILYGKNALQRFLNYSQCETHREAIQTILRKKLNK
jgi:poly-gamma-glutamate synthesis protein (capsule biosynthesis protein)